MMTTSPAAHKTDNLFTAWTTRLLILSLIGIFFLTLFPFRILLHAKGGIPGFPFLLGGWGKSGGAFDDFLNVLLFIPFGFAIGGKFRRRAKSGLATILWALAAGALVSYGVEFLQLYIPLRDSGWTDVLTNGSGAGVGCLLFLLCGVAVLRLLNSGGIRTDELAPSGRHYRALFCPLVRHFNPLANAKPLKQLELRRSAGGWE